MLEKITVKELVMKYIIAKAMIDASIDEVKGREDLTNNQKKRKIFYLKAQKEALESYVNSLIEK